MISRLLDQAGGSHVDVCYTLLCSPNMENKNVVVVVVVVVQICLDRRTMHPKFE